jgi:ADP-L-glycero-D-manno-heptose 6-epimerase
LKILITGSRGFIGSHAVSFWHKIGGHEIYTYEWEERTLPRIEGLDWVFHFGAISSRKYNVNLQWSSSASVYGLGNIFRESAPVDPRSPYAWSKYFFEHYVQNNPSSIRCQGFRYFNVYGANEAHKGTQASPYHQFAIQAQSTGIIKVFEGSENFHRDFISVDHVLGVQFQFINQDIKESGIWNVGTGKTRSFLDVAQEKAMQYGALIEQIPFPEHLEYSYQKYTCADLTKLQQTIQI